MAGEKQEELLHVLWSSVGDVACSMRKDNVLHGAKRKNHFARMCRSVREVAEEDEEDDQFCINSVIHDTEKPWAVNYKIKETDVPFKIDTGADI